jgi:hypothetical protein
LDYRALLASNRNYRRDLRKTSRVCWRERRAKRRTAQKSPLAERDPFMGSLMVHPAYDRIRESARIQTPGS